MAAAMKAAWKAKQKEQKGLTQEKLAELLNMGQAGVSHYLNGRRPFQLQAYLNFCRVLDLDPMKIYPELVSEHGAEQISQASEFVELFANADKEIQESVLTILRSTSSSK